MANNTIKGLTVEIGGDTTKLSKALEGVNQKSKDLSSELGQINKLLKMDPGNADLLAQKQKVLAEAVATTAEKLKTLKEAEKQVQKQFEKGDVSEDQVRALQREIIQTEKKMESYERASRETAHQIDKLGDESQESKKEIDKLGDEAQETGRELDRAGDKASTFGSKAKAAGAIAAKGMAAVATAVAAASAALAKATADAAAYADEVLTLSTVTGISTEKLQAYRYAAELVDVSVETMTKSHAKNIKSMKAAQDGTKLAVDAYQKLGVEVKNADGSLRDGETVYWEVIDALGKMENETERDAIAMQILGKSAQELNPLIEAGSEKMRELTKEAKEVGAVMSEESLAALGEFDDSLQRLKGSAGAAKNAIGTVLLPEMTALTKDGAALLAEFTQNLNTSGGGLEGFISTVDKMSEKIGNKAGELIGKIISKSTSLLPAIINVGTSLIASLVTSVVERFPDLVEAGLLAINALLQGITAGIPQAISAVAGMIPQLVLVLQTGVPLLIQGAVDLLVAICQAIPLVIMPLTESIPQITKAVINGLLSAIPQLITGAVQFLSAIVQAIPQVCQTLAPQIAPIISTVCDGLTSNIPLVLDGALQLLDAICQAIPLICKALLPEIPKIVRTLTDKLNEAFPQLLDAAITLLFALIDAIPILLDSLLPMIPEIVDSVTESLIRATPVLLAGAVKLFFALVHAVGKITIELRKKLPDVLKTINSVLSSLPRVLGDILYQAGVKVSQWVVQLASKGAAAAKGLVNSVINGLKALPQKVATVGKNLAAGIWNGINDKASWLKSKIKGWVGNVTDFLKKLFGINSPSKVTTWMGEMLDEGFAKGIEENTKAPVRAMSKLTDDMLDEAGGMNGLAIERQINHSVHADAAATAQSSNLIGKLDQILKAIERGQILTINGDALVGATVNSMNNALGQRRALAERGAV